MFILNKEVKNIKLLYGFFICLILMWVLRYFCYKQDYVLSLYSFVYYFVDYSNGFITRGLIGTLFGLLLPNNKDFFVSFLKLNDFLVLTWFVIIGALLLLYIYFNKYKAYNNCFYLLFVFTSCTLFLDSYTSLRLELFWSILIVPIVCLLTDKLTICKFIVICLFSVICMLIHQGFIFCFAPLVCVILLEKGNIREFFIYGVLLVLLFLCCTFFSNVDFTYLLNHAYDLIDTRGLTFLLNDYKDYIEYSLSLEYKYNRTEQLKILLEEYITKHVPITLKIICLNLINIIITLRVLNRLIKDRYKKICYSFIFLIPFILLLIFSIDCERWVLLLLQSLHIFVFYKLNNTELHLPVTVGHVLLYLVNFICSYISMAVLLSINYI